jgi:3-oxoacyl-[acyl-carrier protein] reductase
MLHSKRFGFFCWDERNQLEYKFINVNLKETPNCIKDVVETMIKQKYWKIINITSITGNIVGFSQPVHYYASKAGITDFTRDLALELTPYVI